MSKKLVKYYFQNSAGKGLHYVQGSLWWRLPNSVEAVEDFTNFATKKELVAFGRERNINYSSIGRIEINVTTVKKPKNAT